MELPMQILGSTPETEIVSSRIFKVNVETLFRAFSDPKHLKSWWGPKGFSNTFHTFEFKEGGTWKFTMHGPEKGNYENECVFLKIIPNELLVWNRISQPLFQMHLTFEKVDKANTRLIFKMLFNTSEERAKLISFVPEKNEENFDKLENVLLQIP